MAIVAGLISLLAVSSSPSSAAWLGVSVQDLSPPIAEAMDMRETTGVLVTDVVPRGPADLSGVHVRDVIVAVDGTAVETSRDLVARLEARAPGDHVTLRIWRGAHPMNLDVILAEPKSGARSSAPESADRQQRRNTRPFLPAEPPLGGPQIGIEAFPMNEDLARALDVEAVGGVLVLRVREDSPAERAGLKAGDVIRSMNGQAVHEIGDIRSALRTPEAGVTWTAEILRRGRPVRIEGRIDPGWQVPGGEARLEPRPAPGPGPVWAQRQIRALNREIERLRDRVSLLERRLRRSERR